MLNLKNKKRIHLIIYKFFYTKLSTSTQLINIIMVFDANVMFFRLVIKVIKYF